MLERGMLEQIKECCEKFKGYWINIKGCWKGSWNAEKDQGMLEKHQGMSSKDKETPTLTFSISETRQCGLRQPSVHSDVAFLSFDIGSLLRSKVQTFISLQGCISYDDVYI